MRYDFLIIYAHGLPHIRDIMCIVRNFPNIKIDFIKRFSALDICPTMENFIEGIYQCDTVPFEHLQGKTRYLADLSPDFMFILIKNERTEEKTFGVGKFAHIQCARIKELKEIIRDKYNPYQDGKRTENHVIHASDYESQVEYVLDFLGLPPIAHFSRPTEYNLRYFVELRRFEIKKIPISEIICLMVDGKVSVEDGVWLKYVRGDKQPYIDYAEKVIGVNDFDDHYPEVFDKLIDGFKYTDLISVQETSEGFEIKDGSHRVAIVRNCGEDEIMAIVEEMRFSAVPLKKQLSECLVIRRKKYFPEYYSGEDIDMIHPNPHEIGQAILSIIECTITERPNGLHIDIMDEGKIHLRLDIVSSILPGDKEYLKEAFLRADKCQGFKVPCLADEVIFRGIEYMTHTEKNWHFEFIEQL